MITRYARQAMTMLEWLARAGSDPVWKGVQVNYCPQTGFYTYFRRNDHLEFKELTRAQALVILARQS